MSEETKFEVNGRRLYIKKADASIIHRGQSIYSKSFKNAVEEGAILKKSLDQHMSKQGLWTKEKEEEYMSLIHKSADIEFKIKNREYKKASELRDKSLELKKIRDDISSLLSIRNSMDSVTAEGRADNDRFAYFVSACIYDYETKKPVFESMQDYEEQSNTELAAVSATKLAVYMYGIDEDYEDNLVENRVLKRLGLLDKNGYLTNAAGQRIDLDGNLINEDGARVDADGNRIDINNNPLIEDDVIDEIEFEDDLGLTVNKEQEEVPVAETKRKRTKKVSTE